MIFHVDATLDTQPPLLRLAGRAPPPCAIRHSFVSSPLCPMRSRAATPIDRSCNRYTTVAAGTQISGIISQGGEDVPWNLIAFIIPGVVIGGQLAPRMQGRLSQRTMEKILSGVFGAVGTTFAVISFKSLMAITSASAVAIS